MEKVPELIGQKIFKIINLQSWD